jgi:glycosyltransferase involved in cell wall biosynthesis
MAMGVPCVVTDVGDAAMLVADTGVVVPKEDSSALALGLGQLLTLEADVLHAQGQMARQRIVAEFTIMRARDRFEAVYQRVANESIH